MEYSFKNPEDELDKENNQYYGEDNSRNGTDDDEGGDFETGYNDGFYGNFDDNNNDDD
ncbi:hypothetical protein [Flavobacterium psychrolimnae]|jgi:hypothetical protein|uniref:hypothetical protein n=1 Tax=Flavobacterium psychrolimnae TaxID=249351 RepID=UPI00142D1EF4|nr:hypothetical protein [Flavobacterium psychrolimnae]